MKIDEFDYELPEELIAQAPLDKRDACRLMAIDRKTGAIKHEHFYDIKKHLKPGDCLVLNDSRVIPARLLGHKKDTGANIEILLIKRIEGDDWECMVRPGKRLKEGSVVTFDTDTKFEAHVGGIKDPDNGTRIITFEYDGIFMERLEEIGSMPLPKYIKRPADDKDKETYQTVYSHIEGSVAAPTAGLHFTKELLAEIADMGVDIAYVTLHVGIGTFRPVKCENIEEHKMHFEEFSISEKDAGTINRAVEEGRMIVAVGTTSVRTLESAAGEDGKVEAGSRSTGIFIYPGYEFKTVDAIITNFHLPKSTLIMLVSAFYDREKILAAYEEAVKERYRFFSYGDAMLLE